MMLFRAPSALSAIAVFSLCFLSPASGAALCKSDIDCEGNLDCIRVVGVFEKRCLPASCTKGAGYALLESGFDTQDYLAEVKSKAGFTRDREFMTLSDAEDMKLSDAMKTTKPPMEVFNNNLTACLNPAGEDGEIQPKQQESVSRTYYGLQVMGIFGTFLLHWQDCNLGGRR
jgi:hypothetical protein